MSIKRRWPRTAFACCAASVLVSVACSAQPAKSNSDFMGATASSPREAAFEDCLQVGAWSEREECFARLDDQSIETCEEAHPRACKPYRDMYFVAQRMRELEDEIAEMSTSTYRTYLASDPEYVDDLVGFLRKSGESWRVHRDAHCQLESYVDGMSRSESGDIVQQCRLGKTRQYLLELEALLTSLKSNKE